MRVCMCVDRLIDVLIINMIMILVPRLRIKSVIVDRNSTSEITGKLLFVYSSVHHWVALPLWGSITINRSIDRSINQSINQSVRDCLCSRATSRLIVCIRNAGSDDNVRIWFSEEPGFKLLTEEITRLWRRYLLRQSVPDKCHVIRCLQGYAT